MERPLLHLANSPQQQKFGQDKLDRLPLQCRQCEFRFACNGGCPKHRFLMAPDSKTGFNYLCAGYQKFFRHIDPFMRFMANEFNERRPPANVMGWIRQQDLGSIAGKAPGRNDPCLCGSGRKYKKCCGKAN
jgi:uncharacterized protein